MCLTFLEFIRAGPGRLNLRRLICERDHKHFSSFSREARGNKKQMRGRLAFCHDTCDSSCSASTPAQLLIKMFHDLLPLLRGNNFLFNLFPRFILNIILICVTGLASRSSATAFSESSQSLLTMMNAAGNSLSRTSRFPCRVAVPSISDSLLLISLDTGNKKKARKQLFMREINSGKDTRWT